MVRSSAIGLGRTLDDLGEPASDRQSLVREWGRRGSPGTVRLSSYAMRNEAETAEQRTIKRRLRRGYIQPSGRSDGAVAPCHPSSACGIGLQGRRRRSGGL
jgi:predicted DNA-binding WGR domain protein